MECATISIELTSYCKHILHFSGIKMLNGKTCCGYACEIWAMIDGQIGFTYLSTETHSPYTVCYSQSARGKTVAYRLRWVNKQGDVSPWSEMLKIIIT